MKRLFLVINLFLLVSCNSSFSQSRFKGYDIYVYRESFTFYCKTIDVENRIAYDCIKATDFLTYTEVHLGINDSWATTK